MVGIKKVCGALQAIYDAYLSCKQFARALLESLQISGDELSCEHIGIQFQCLHIDWYPHVIQISP